MDEFDDGVIGRVPGTQPFPTAPQESDEDGTIRAGDPAGLVIVTARAGRIEDVHIQPRGLDQPTRLGAAIAQATNAILERYDQHRNTIAQAETLAGSFDQMQAQTASATKQFDQALAEIDQVQRTLSAHLEGLREVRRANQPD